MLSSLEVHILGAQHCHVEAMAHIFLDSFRLDGSVKLMYTREEIWAVIQDILHDYMDDNRIIFLLAVSRDSGFIAGWMSYGIIPVAGPVPEFAFNEMTSWAAQRLLRGRPGDPRFRLAAFLEDQSRRGQVQHMPSNRLVINTIVTDPMYRGSGVADKLLRSAVEHARPGDWTIWAQTPAVYEGLFWRNGFQGVGAFSLDLNDFKSEEEKVLGFLGRQFGVQTWKQMKRGSRAELVLPSVAYVVGGAMPSRMGP